MCWAGDPWTRPAAPGPGLPPIKRLWVLPPAHVTELDRLPTLGWLDVGLCVVTECRLLAAQGRPRGRRGLGRPGLAAAPWDGLAHSGGRETQAWEESGIRLMLLTAAGSG